MTELDQLLKEFNNLEFSGLFLQVVLFSVWAIFILFLTWIIRKGISKAISDNTMRYRTKKATQLLGYALIFLLAIITFTGKVQYFSLAIGLISAGLAFALQEVILSVAGWVVIFSSNIYKPGDRIEINNVKGDVIDIGITRTTLMEIGKWVASDNYNGRIVQLSNSFVFKGPVHNYSTDFPFVWDEINLKISSSSDLTLAYECILETARSILQEYTNYARDHWKKMVKKYLIEDANVEPTVCINLTDNWVEFNLRYVVNYNLRRSTKDHLFFKIQEAIMSTKGKVEFAITSFGVINVPDLKIEMNKSTD